MVKMNNDYIQSNMVLKNKKLEDKLDSIKEKKKKESKDLVVKVK